MCISNTPFPKISDNSYPGRSSDLFRILQSSRSLINSDFQVAKFYKWN